MTWCLFTMGALLTFDSLYYRAQTSLTLFLCILQAALGSGIMIAAIYLRSIGW